MNAQDRIAVRKWVQEAIALYEASGKEAVLAEIADPSGRFVSDDRYIFALNLSGTVLAHPLNTELTGRNLIDLKDCDGKPFIRRIIDISKARGYGYMEYKWSHPKRKGDYHKTIFFERVEGMILCSGFYGD